MKVECEQCHELGYLQVRGNTRRVQHYKGFREGKRLYIFHRVSNIDGYTPIERSDLKGFNRRSFTELENALRTGGKGFEPLTLSLEG